ncbi:PQ-loop domain-containing transporter [Eremococcus coleocola]|uniref:PQ-loop domain-containing transporter n=1 Tax=Eremococcus coleocola TaxID=88132 RepID=UPI0003FD9A59|nr:PQ-loop domain-containing transporter [Eremococcus coleocola]
MKKLLLTWAPLVSAVCITISYLPQLWLTFTTHNVSGQSLGFWTLLVISLFGLVLQQYGLIRYEGNKSYVGFITQLINFSFALIMLIMVIIFS